MGLLFVVTGLVVVFGLIYLVSLAWPFVVDYRFGPEGIDIVVIGGLVRLFRIKKENIRTVEVLDSRSSRAFVEAQFALRLPNRIRRKVLLVKTTGIVKWVLTPSDAVAAARELGLR